VNTYHSSMAYVSSLQKSLLIASKDIVGRTEMADKTCYFFTPTLLSFYIAASFTGP